LCDNGRKYSHSPPHSCTGNAVIKHKDRRITVGSLGHHDLADYSDIDSRGADGMCRRAANGSRGVGRRSLPATWLDAGYHPIRQLHELHWPRSRPSRAVASSSGRMTFYGSFEAMIQATGWRYLAGLGKHLRRAGSYQDAHRFIGGVRNPNFGELAGAVQPRQHYSIAPVRIDPISRFDRDQRRRNHRAAVPKPN
jgi:hypothetical protein